MWLLADRSAPEKLVAAAAQSATKIKDAVDEFEDEAASCSKAKLAFESLDDELRELKLILIGARLTCSP